MPIKILLNIRLYLLFFACLPFHATGKPPQKTPYERIDSLLKQATELNAFSGNVLIVHARHVVYDQSFGKADMAKNIVNTTETKFQLASVTKDFTRVMILILEQKGMISTGDRLNKYLEGFSEDVGKVTISQLMNFTSGLGDYHQSPELRNSEGKEMIIKDIVPVIKKERLQFEPGTRVLYSNSGYVLLGAIIEALTHKTYYENLKELILDKLDMHSTGVNGYAPPMPGIAIGYLNNEIGAIQNNAGWVLPGAGDGGVYTTTHDLLKFITSVFYDNQLLADSSKLKYVNTKMKDEQFSSWNEFVLTGRYAPAGGAPGVSALFAVNMKTENIAIILSNYDQGTAENIWERILAILNDRPVNPLRAQAPKYFYTLIKSKGGAYFEKNYKQELANFGDRVGDMDLYKVGQELIKENDLDNAIALYKVFTKEFPEIIIAWNDMGEVYAQKGDKANAKICFENALKIN